MPLVLPPVVVFVDSDTGQVFVVLILTFILFFVGYFRWSCRIKISFIHCKQLATEHKLTLLRVDII
jgi:cell division protein FtsW (lipid II flippase)